MIFDDTIFLHIIPYVVYKQNIPISWKERIREQSNFNHTLNIVLILYGDYYYGQKDERRHFFN